MRMKRKQPWVGLSICLIVLLPFLQKPVSAEFNPSDVAILTNTNSSGSMAVAKYYARQRGIPASHILELATSTKETISREEYEESIVQPIREALETKNLAAKVRVLVATYGIPLRVRAPRPAEQEATWLEDAKEWRKSSVGFLQELKKDIERIAVAFPASVHSNTSSQLSELNMDQRRIESLIQQVNQAVTEATHRIEQLKDANKRKIQERTLEKSIQRVNGLAGKVQFLRHFSQKTSGPGDIQLTNLRAQISSAEQVLSFLLEVQSEKGRERAYQVAQESFGVVGVIRFANQEIQRLSFTQADASVDSELSLVWWDRADMHPSGKQYNPLYAWYPAHIRQRGLRLPLMLVSRIDAPTPDLAKRMIDYAILAEQTGLTGKAYIDARGVDSKQLLSSGHYDRNMRMFAEGLKRISSYQVVLENTERRFSNPGDAPHVGMYVGWYRLRRYEDAFTFNPGAIGYHIASNEAVSLHNPSEPGWCKNALERGITVTLGSVTEPYLDAFPLPTEFFGLLLTGRYSLVEAYYLSTRYLSWQMVLVGDPLYNPWRGGQLAQKVKDSRFLKLQVLPVPPSDQGVLDPILARRTLQKERSKMLSRLSLDQKH